YVRSSAPDMTPEKLIIALKGITAIQLAKVGITEADRKPYQPYVDAVISAAVTKWLELHAKPNAVTLPIMAKLVRLA
ncbi:MAG: hypothetical protein ACREJC_21220, partial [Tepidisphaeraceae bacterium]